MSCENFVTSRHIHLLASVPVLAVMILVIVGKPNTKNICNFITTGSIISQCCYVTTNHTLIQFIFLGIKIRSLINKYV